MNECILDLLLYNEFTNVPNCTHKRMVIVHMVIISTFYVFIINKALNYHHIFLCNIVQYTLEKSKKSIRHTVKVSHV